MKTQKARQNFFFLFKTETRLKEMTWREWEQPIMRQHPGTSPGTRP